MTEDNGKNTKAAKAANDAELEVQDEAESSESKGRGASQLSDVDDRYPERDPKEQEALLQEYDEQEFGDDVEIVDSTIEQIVERARGVSSKLGTALRGSVLLEIEGTDNKYHFNWTAKDFKFSQDEEKGDCTISLSKRHLAQIAKGKLNPQIAMLSDKIKVAGKSSIAVYFFNVVAPVPRS